VGSLEDGFWGDGSNGFFGKGVTGVFGGKGAVEGGVLWSSLGLEGGGKDKDCKMVNGGQSSD